jgi:hypothetical protein
MRRCVADGLAVEVRQVRYRRGLRKDLGVRDRQPRGPGDLRVPIMPPALVAAI